MFCVWFTKYPPKTLWTESVQILTRFRLWCDWPLLADGETNLHNRRLYMDTSLRKTDWLYCAVIQMVTVKLSPCLCNAGNPRFLSKKCKNKRCRLSEQAKNGACPRLCSHAFTKFGGTVVGGIHLHKNQVSSTQHYCYHPAQAPASHC